MEESPRSATRRLVAQLLAAGSVVLSLLFVGYEIRQNTQVARQEAYLAFTQEMNALSYSITNDAELAALQGRVMDGALADEFDSGQRLRIELTFISLVRVWEGLYRSRTVGIADDAYFSGLRGSGPYQTAYFRSFWPTIRETVTPEFAEYFEAEVWGDD